MKRLIALVSFVLIQHLASAPAMADMDSSSTTSLSGAITESSADMIRLKAVDRRSLSQALLFPAKDRTILSFTPEASQRSESYRGLITGNRTDRDYRETRYVFKATQSLGRSDWAIDFEGSLGRGSSTLKRTGQPQGDFIYVGFGDVSLTARSVVPLGRANAQYGITGSFSPGDREWAAADQDGNLYSGGHSVKPFGAYEMPVRHGVVGASLAYTVYGERTEVDKAGNGQILASDKIRGGNTLEARAFTEYQKLWFSIGALAGVIFADGGSITVMDGTSMTTDAATYALASLYGTFKVAPSFDLAPKIAYRTLMSKEINSVSFDRSDELATSLSALVNF
jgi:hypothetical protein